MATSLAESLAGLASDFAAGADALGSLGLPASGPGEAAEAAEKLRQATTSALGTGVKFLPLTPFVPGVGTRKGEYAYLTPEHALSCLANRFAGADVGEKKNEEAEMALVVLLIVAQTHDLLGQALSTFNKVYPIPDLERASRRAKALATLEVDKFVIPRAPDFPPWQEMSPQKNKTGLAVAKAIGGMVAAGEGAAKAAAAPGDMLAKFAQKQAAKLAQKTADLEALSESMTGGMDTWIGFYAQGSGAAIFRYLSKVSSPFDAAFKCSSLLCWYGSPETVSYYRESFGLCKRHLTAPECLVCPGWSDTCPF